MFWYEKNNMSHFSCSCFSVLFRFSVKTYKIFWQLTLKWLWNSHQAVPDSVASMVVHFSWVLPWYSNGNRQGSGLAPIVLQGAEKFLENVEIITLNTPLHSNLMFSSNWCTENNTQSKSCCSPLYIFNNIYQAWPNFFCGPWV